MKIVFVKPAIGGFPGRPFRPGYEIQPLEFAILAGLTPPHVDVTLYDDRIEDIPVDPDADLIGITTDTFTAKRAYVLADGFRKRGIPVVMGGLHASLLPEEAAEHADCVVMGEADELWPQLVSDFEAGKMKPRYQATRRAPLQGLRPDRSIFKGKRYVPAQLVEFGRGCRNRCKYCSVSRFYGHDYQHRPITDVVDEIRAFRHREIYFSDDNIVSDVETAKAFFSALAPLRIKWSGQMSIAFTHDDSLLDLMAASGCRNLLLGLESLNAEDLRAMHKAPNSDPPSYASGLAALRQRGIRIWGSFMFGFDHDTEATITHTLDFAESEHLFLANCNILTPCPGTVLYEELANDKRLLFDAWWLNPDYRFAHAVHRPAMMTPDELTEHCFGARRRFNSMRSIMKRSREFRANCRTVPNAFTYFIYNAVFRHEMYRKQGLVLGAR